MPAQVSGRDSAMCGIAGFTGRLGVDHRKSLVGMLRAMGHRGPDDQGSWFDGDTGLGHVRLSILDTSSRGHQPFVTEDGMGVLTYNGEIYNYPLLRAELEREGVVFASDTDTEVVLYALHRWGPERAVPRLNGMFALAYRDARTGTVWLARDRMGIKPLYLWRQNGALVFASEQKGLFAHPCVPRELDLHALVDLVLFERFEGAMTPYRQVEALAPGSLLSVTDGRERTLVYFDLLRDLDVPRIPRDKRGAADWLGQAEELLSSSVNSQLASDVPLATLCSGGLDSGLVTALARRSMTGLVAYVADIEGMRGEELRRSRLVANALGVELRTVSVTPESFYGRLPAAIQANDQPLFFSQDVATLMLAERISADGFKVVLSGDGADEIFGGYDWHAAAWRRWRRHRLRDRWLRPVFRFLPLPSLRERWRIPDLERLAADPFGALRGRAGAVDGLNVSLVDGARRALLQARLFRKLDALPHHEDRAYLTRSFEDVYVHMRERLGTLDRMTMSASLEARVPFLDNGLIDFGLHLPMRAKFRDGVTKRLIKDLGSRYLPGEILHLPKIGFRLHPVMFRGIGAILQGGRVAELLKWRREDEAEIIGLLARQPFYQFRLVTMECWLRMQFDGESAEAIGQALLRLRTPVA
jgi:asparagine synthase (glutamine-hydrolysing)